MNKLKIITSTTREGRKGIFLAEWLTEFAKENSEFEVELLDLAKINLPFVDEPDHPRLKKYRHEHTKLWSAMIDPADAFVIILGEYNCGFPAPIKNAFDFLFNEWKHKPVGFVSYGGVSGGMRALQMIKQVVTTFNMMPVTEAVSIPFFAKQINEQNKFVPEEPVVKSAANMLKELYKWSEVMKPLRQQ